MSTLSKSKMAVWAAGLLIAAMIPFTAARSTNTSAANPPDPPEVSVVRVEQQDVPIYREWIGRMDRHSGRDG